MEIVAPEGRRVIAPVDESELPEVKDTAMRASHATFRDEAAEEAEREAKQKEAESAAAPQGQATQPQGQPELPEKFRGKSVQDIVKSYTELEAHSTRLATENAELKKKPVSQSSSQESGNLEIPAELEEELFNSPKTAVAKIVDLAVKTAVGQVSDKSKSQSREDAVKETREWFMKTHPTLDRTAALMIEGLAAEAEGSSMLEKFQNATDTYLKTVKATAISAENSARESAAETERQIAAAEMPSGKKPTGNGRKVWRESDIEWMMENDPSQYQRLQGEIVKARQEGRVRVDL